MNWDRYATEQRNSAMGKYAERRSVKYNGDNDNVPRVVGLMGYGGAGKSEAKRFLAMRYGYEGQHIKTPLRAMCVALLREAGISDEMIDRYLDGDLKRDVIPALRRSGTEIQQELGTAFGRDFCYPELWLDLWGDKTDAILASGGRVVQESVRFPNEASAVRKRGGIILDITRPGVGPLNGHKSEVRPAIADAVVPNTGTIAQLHALLDETLSGWAA